MNYVSELPNTALDAAYGASFDSKDAASIQFYGAEIRRRLTDVGSFLWSLVGVSEFPIYDAKNATIGGTSQVDAAQSSAADAVVNAPATIVNAATDVVKGAGEVGKSVFSAVSPFVWGAIIVGGIAVYAALRK